MNAIALFVLTSLALVGSPGPNTLSLTALGAAFGTRRGVPFMVGLDLGMIGVIVLVSSGLSAALLALPGVAPVVTAVATAYLLYLAYRIGTAPPIGTSAEARIAAPHWYAGVALSLTNPKAYIAVAALMPRSAFWPDRWLADLFVKAVLLLAAIVLVNMLWLLAGSVLASRISNRTVGRMVNLGFAGLLVASVAIAAFL